MKINFIFHPDNPFLTGKHFDVLYYDFFIKELPKHCQVNFIKQIEPFDCQSLPDADVFLLYGVHPRFCPRLLNIDKVQTPKIMFAGESHCRPWHAKELNFYGMNDQCFFGNNTEQYFRKFYGEDPSYRQIIIGLDPDNYTKNQRIYKDVILNSGTLGRKHYMLRQQCNKVNGVRYVGPKEGFVGRKYPQLLSRYAASIAASTYFFGLRYLEIAFAGCVPFMEVNGINGAESLGYIDGETAIFIDDNNYIEKFNEYLQSFNDRKWQDIANNAHDFVMQNYQVSHGVQRLLKYIEEIL